MLKFNQKTKEKLDAINDHDDSTYCDFDTRVKALAFLRHQIIMSDGSIDLPKILPGPDKSIDLFWQFDSYELLMNFSADDSIANVAIADSKNHCRRSVLADVIDVASIGITVVMGMSSVLDDHEGSRLRRAAPPPDRHPHASTSPS